MDIFSRVRDCDFPFLRGVPELVMIPLNADDVPVVLLKYFYEFSGTISFPDDFPSIVTLPLCHVHIHVQPRPGSVPTHRMFPWVYADGSYSPGRRAVLPYFTRTSTFLSLPPSIPPKPQNLKNEIPPRRYPKKDVDREKGRFLRKFREAGVFEMGGI